MLRELFHVHRDPDWKFTGVFSYYECRCGARRTGWTNRKLIGPVQPGFPGVHDRHGRMTYDSGWVKP